MRSSLLVLAAFAYNSHGRRMQHQGKERSARSDEDRVSAKSVSDGLLPSGDLESQPSQAVDPLAVLLARSSSPSAGFQLLAHGRVGLSAGQRGTAPVASEGSVGDQPINSQDLEALRKRIANIDEDEIRSQEQAVLKARIADFKHKKVEQRFYNLVTSSNPADMVRSFKEKAPPEVTTAMDRVVSDLVGRMDASEFRMNLDFTQEQLWQLMLHLQKLGYMYRNVAHVQSIRDVLGLQSQSEDEVRATFRRLDLDGSHFIETNEIEELLARAMGTDAQSEVIAFQSLFDANHDGKISEEEWMEILKRPDAVVSAIEAEIEPEVSGKVALTYPDDRAAEMEAPEVVAKLKAEKQVLLARLSAADKKSSSMSFSDYVNSLPKQQSARLTASMTPEVQNVMKRIAEVLLKGGKEERAGLVDENKHYVVNQPRFELFAFFQLVAGYCLREYETTIQIDDTPELAE